MNIVRQKNKAAIKHLILSNLHLHCVASLKSFYQPCRYKSVSNPFKKKSKHQKFSRSDFKDVTRICATILGNGGVGQPRCVGLFTDHKGILFNCGEGVGRILREHESAFHHIRHVFVTQRDWNNLSGLADIYLTHEAYGIDKLNLFGPPGIERFASVITGEVSHTKLVKRNLPYSDDTFEISPINVTAKRLLPTGRQENKSIEDVVVSYVCKVLEKPAELCYEKLIKYNVPMGPHLLKLKNKEDIILPSGSIIHALDVIDSMNEEEILLIIDCPSENFLLSFVTKGEFSRYQLPSESASRVTMVFHFSPPHVMETKLYQNWMKRFHPETQHIVLNSSCSTISSSAVYQTQSLFHALHPDIFKLLPKPVFEAKDFNLSPKLLQASSMLQLQIRPKREENWSNVVNYIPENYIEETKYFPNFIEEANILKSAINSQSMAFSEDTQKYPEVIFLGTSSATSSAYRNVTAILVNVSDNNSILLDCGEGTHCQFVRYFGTENVDAELRKISCIFISHLHTDHYLGLFQLIKARIEAFQKSAGPYKPIVLLLPHRIHDAFKQYCMIFDPLSVKVRIISCKSLTRGEKKDILEKYIGNTRLETVRVKHCPDAHGLILENHDWKIVYSGDSAPCHNLIEAGKNCDLLIHEASIEDGCLNEAMVRKHSTPSQVIDIAEKMNAKYTILTHFSKRYLAIPVFEHCSNKAVGCAFDFMKVRLNQLSLVPLFLPAVKTLFQEQLEKHADRTSFYTNFENNFFKTYKQNNS